MHTWRNIANNPRRPLAVEEYSVCLSAKKTFPIPKSATWATMSSSRRTFCGFRSQSQLELSNPIEDTPRYLQYLLLFLISHSTSIDSFLPRTQDKDAVPSFHFLQTQG